MRTRLFLIVLLLCVAGSPCHAADEVALDNGRVVNLREAHGLDQVYPFELEEPVPVAPKGYEPFHIEHYGRHGSRFAYNYIYYDVVKTAFDQAEAKGVLTEFGHSLKAEYDSHYPHYHMRMGDLTQIGWEQQLRLGREMAANYPKIFKHTGAQVYAVSSDSRRSMMSMSAFCLGLGQAVPQLEITEDQGNCHLNATQPKSRNNPFLDKNCPEHPFPFGENENEFCRRKTNCCPIALSRLFTDPEAALQGIGEEEFLRRLYVLVAGMPCLAPEDRTDFSGLFTPEEFAGMWEVDNYQRYREYFNYPAKTIPVLRDMLNCANQAIEEGKYGANLRFGHDHVVMPLFILLHLNGYTRQPSSSDEISAVFTGFDCPMASNIQLVLYRSRKGGDVLVNIRVNGRNAVVDGLESVVGTFYSWNDFRDVIYCSQPVK